LKGIFLGFARQVLGEYGNKGYGEGALRKEAPQEVGDTKSYKKSIRRHTGAEEPGHHHVPNQPENAAQERYRTQPFPRPGSTFSFSDTSRISGFQLAIFLDTAVINLFLIHSTTY
jgi:hypothetical protein